ncbi:MAG: cytochrome c3 family protein, partial [Pirellulales bacterium]
HASVPPTATCINCHSPIVDGGAPKYAAVRSGSDKLKAVHQSWATDKSVPWVKIHRLPDFVFFNHSAHVNRGVSCAVCHGRIDTMDKVYQAKELSMAWCLECHNNPDPNLRPLDKITKLDWKPEDSPEFKAAEWRAENDIHPKTNCAVCHR